MMLTKRQKRMLYRQAVQALGLRNEAPNVIRVEPPLATVPLNDSGPQHVGQGLAKPVRDMRTNLAQRMGLFHRQGKKS